MDTDHTVGMACSDCAKLIVTGDDSGFRDYIRFATAQLALAVLRRLTRSAGNELNVDMAGGQASQCFRCVVCDDTATGEGYRVTVSS